MGTVITEGTADLHLETVMYYLVLHTHPPHLQTLNVKLTITLWA